MVNRVMGCVGNAVLKTCRDVEIAVCPAKPGDMTVDVMAGANLGGFRGLQPPQMSLSSLVSRPSYRDSQTCIESDSSHMTTLVPRMQFHFRVLCIYILY